MRTHNTHRSAARGAAGGFSLVELMVVASLLSSVVGSILVMGRANERAYRTGSGAAHLEAQAAMTIERIVPELRIAQLASVAPDPLSGVGADAVEYVQATGLSGGTIVTGALRRLAFEYETGELDDGLDNNGNGLVDEGRGGRRGLRGGGGGGGRGGGPRGGGRGGGGGG
jgi:hypothetical protein